MVQARSNRVAVRLPSWKIRRDGHATPGAGLVGPLRRGKVRLSGTTGQRPARKAKMQEIGCRFACPLA
jgi:hypothetical protein